MSTDKSDPSTAQGDTNIEELRQLVEEQQNRINELEQRQKHLDEQHQQVTGLFEQFKTGKISRRAFLTSVSALAGVGYLAGSASAATPNWSNASGYAGTESTPLIATHAQEGTFQSVSTEQIQFSGLSISTIAELSSAYLDTDHTHQQNIQFTDGVSTTATAVWTDSGDSFSGGRVHVVGRDASNNEFSEVVVLSRLGTTTVLGSATRGTPSSRSYAVDGFDLDLTMGSGTYNVAAVGSAMGVPQP